MDQESSNMKRELLNQYLVILCFSCFTFPFLPHPYQFVYIWSFSAFTLKKCNGTREKAILDFVASVIIFYLTPVVYATILFAAAFWKLVGISPWGIPILAFLPA